VLLGLLKAFMEDPVAKLGALGTFGSLSARNARPTQRHLLQFFE